MRWAFWVPRRRRGVELLDSPDIDPAIRVRSIGDVVRSNRWFGGARAARAELRGALEGTVRATVLDVGVGLGDVVGSRPDAATVTTIGVDLEPSLLVAARARGAIAHVVCADALALPFGARAVDVVLCSQLLHHFQEPESGTLLRELHRVARRRVIVSDLRRSWLAAAGFWIASFVLRFHPVTRHDGVVSVLRGFTASELRAGIHRATGARPVVKRRPGFRLTASWSPAATEHAT